ncbi:MAG TPA: AMP-binding protein [Candidatus Acidoferrales bacterium]
MTFLESIFERLQRASNAPVLAEVRDGKIVSMTGGELLALIGQARTFLVARGFKKGDRCALLAPNSIRWVALDLAMMAEGLIVVPLYARQAPVELAAMLKDSTPVRICCSDARLAAEIVKFWPAAPKISLLDGIFTGDSTIAPSPMSAHADSDPLTIIYTSGTSGEPKGVVLNIGNVNFMLESTGARLDELMRQVKKPNGEAERIFHYLPFCFAASWILLLTALSRNSVLTLSTDLSKLSDELKLAEPDYFLNVPTLLERVRGKIEEAVRLKGGFAAKMFSRAQRAYANRLRGQRTFADSISLYLANNFMFPTIRRTIGANLKALISGSAPLSPETQQFFMMIGIPVLQAYGLTETTAICTLDVPGRVEPGRVGPAIPGIEMTLGENDEILVRGPNIFSGYWQRPEATAKALEGGWFHTGDQGEKDANGNWRISGRLKNLIILNSGHNIAPEPLEDALARALPEAAQVVIVGNQRSFLAALVTAQPSNGLKAERVQAAVDAANAGLPHYKTIRAFHIVPEPLTIENGMLTANGKLKRDAIVARFAAEIERMFEKKSA